jgi:hypothetical protein
MPSSRVVSREQALKNKFERQLKVAEAGRKTARGRQAAMSETLDFFVGGPARGIGRSAKTVAKGATTVAKGATKRTVQDVQNVGQFSSNAAKGVIREA